MPNSPPTSLLIADLTSSLLSSNVYLSQEEKGQYISSTDVNPVLAGISSRFSASQLAEEDCSVVVSGASSLKNYALEESKIMFPGKFIKVSDTAFRYLCLTIVGTIATFGLTLASISIVALGNGISLKVPLGSDSQTVEIETISNQETPE